MRRLTFLVLSLICGCGTAVPPKEEKAMVPDAPTSSASGANRQRTRATASTADRPVRKPITKPELAQVTAKEIELLGHELVKSPERRFLAGTFQRTSDLWALEFMADPNMVGIEVVDEKGTPFQLAFIDKTKFGRDLVQLEKDSPIVLIGQVRSLKQTRYFFVVDELRK